MIIACRLSGPESAPRRVAALAACLSTMGGLTRPQAYRLRLAADEITTNIWLHGYRGCPGVVDLSAGVEPARVWLRTEDDAPPFDPCSHDPDPDLALDPIERVAGRLGLYLARTGLDQLGYEYAGCRNRNTLIMRRPLNGGNHDADDGAGRR